MKRQHIAGIYASPEAFGGQTLTVCGWARTIRDMKNFGFIELNDGSCFKSLQVVLERGKLENYDEVARQNVGAAFIVHGELVLTPDAKQPFELKADSITLEGASAPDYPLQKKRHSVEFLRTIQHLRPRTNLFSATFRVRSVAAQAVHTFFQERGFVYVQTPIITGSDCEGAGEMFRVTTLDLDLQDVADKALRRQLEAQNALWGTTIVMEVHTGEILAMVNLGRNADGSFAERENYALGRSMEPGSTFKLATMLTLLDDARMPVSTIYDTHNGDPVTVGPARNIRDSHRGDREIDFRRAVASSSNVYFAKAIWDRYGSTGKKQEYSDFLHKELHLGETVGLERLGERKPSITTDWKVPDPGVMLVKMSYGYRVRLAPIQMITFYNAIANGGKMISPVLVRCLRRGDRVEERFESRTIASSIASRAALREVHECLQAVCTEGTASAFFRDTTRLRVAAKTGTAQITDARSREGRYYLGSMVAYFPADAPRYTVLTTIETRAQAGKAYYGGPLAGPVVKRMVDYIFNRGRDWYGRVDDGGPRRYPDRMKGGDIAQIRRVADKLSPRVSFESRTGWGRVAVDSLSNVVIASLPGDRGVMPDVRGMGLKDALFVLESRGLKVRFSGRGAVTQQSIAAGARIAPGTAVVITLK